MTSTASSGITGNRCLVSLPDLVVLVPSRGRPQNIVRLRVACAATCQLRTVLHFGFDNDDPTLAESILATGEVCPYTTSDRMHLAPWTNHLASFHMDAPYLASLGDDMLPVTPGWDRMLVDAARGGRMSYPELGRGVEHGRQPGIPEAICMDTRIVAGLGWMCLPALDHWYVDNVWRDLGTGAGCLTYVPDAIVLHKHPNVPGGDKPDRTYHDAAARYDHDLTAYQRWRLRRMREDISAVRRVREAQAHPV